MDVKNEEESKEISIVEWMKNLMLEKVEQKTENEFLRELLHLEKRNSAELKARAETLQIELDSMKQISNGFSVDIEKIDLKLNSMKIQVQNLEKELETFSVTKSFITKNSVDFFKECVIDLQRDLMSKMELQVSDMYFENVLLKKEVYFHVQKMTKN